MKRECPIMITCNTENKYLKLQSGKESSARSYPHHFPLVIEKAEGMMITGVEGNVFYDCLCGAGTLALGHNHPVVIQAIEGVIKQHTPLHTLDLATPLKIEFMQ